MSWQESKFSLHQDRTVELQDATIMHVENGRSRRYKSLCLTVGKDSVILTEAEFEALMLTARTRKEIFG
jgi:hypothetical protein